MKRLLPLAALALLVGCATPAPISNSPMQNVTNATTNLLPGLKPVQATVQQGFVDAEWNLDQAISVGALPANDPADACLHGALTAMGIEPAPAGTPAKVSPSFTPRESDLISTGSVLYILAQQAKAMAPGGTIVIPASCKSIIGQIVLDAGAATSKLIPGNILPTIQ